VHLPQNQQRRRRDTTTMMTMPMMGTDNAEMGGADNDGDGTNTTEPTEATVVGRGSVDGSGIGGRGPGRTGDANRECNRFRHDRRGPAGGECARGGEGAPSSLGSDNGKAVAREMQVRTDILRPREAFSVQAIETRIVLGRGKDRDVRG